MIIFYGLFCSLISTIKQLEIFITFYCCFLFYINFFILLFLFRTYSCILIKSNPTLTSFTLPLSIFPSLSLPPFPSSPFLPPSLPPFLPSLSLSLSFPFLSPFHPPSLLNLFVIRSSRLWRESRIPPRINQRIL